MWLAGRLRNLSTAHAALESGEWIVMPVALAAKTRRACTSSSSRCAVSPLCGVLSSRVSSGLRRHSPRPPLPFPVSQAWLSWVVPGQQLEKELLAHHAVALRASERRGGSSPPRRSVSSAGAGYFAGSAEATWWTPFFLNSSKLKLGLVTELWHWTHRLAVGWPLMNFFRSSALAATCMLPGPWQFSQVTLMSAAFLVLSAPG